MATLEDSQPTLDGNLPYVGSWEAGTDIKLLCNGASASIYASLVHILRPDCNLDRFETGQPDFNSNST